MGKSVVEFKHEVGGRLVVIRQRDETWEQLG